MNRELVKTIPGGTNPDLAESRQTLSTCLKEPGQIRDALATSKESVEIFRRLYFDYPMVFRPLLADALDVLRDCLQVMGRTEEAASAGEEVYQLCNCF